MLSLEQLKEKVIEDDKLTITKDEFKLLISKYENDGFEVSTEFNGEFYRYEEWISNVEELHSYIQSLSTCSQYHEFYLKKKAVSKELNDGEYKTNKHETFETPADSFVRIYESEEQSEYDFNGLLKYLIDTLDSTEVFDRYKDKQITVAIESLRKLKGSSIYTAEIDIIEGILNKRTCCYCKSTVVNAPYAHYVDNHGCVGKTHICPDCLGMYDAEIISVFNSLPKNISNKERVEAISYICKRFTE